ncbi:MAG: hypothetical protein A2901_01875 [Elusimicrobia bacterium RIFCSPLOWO2_01_FULL_54_10]|nr:MAG: hypothetical protein A2901_01875 [Elusimicrobia bacterium RIFCSPLOWO2_01_FULL_54_10]
MTAMDLETLVGQKLTIGVPGTKVTPEIVRHFKDLRAGGIIFYRINFESPTQLKKMITDLEDALERKILVTADHEGGRVVMFRDGITVFPDNLAFGKTGKIEYARKQGAIEAKELRRLGVDVNLGPCLDVLTDSYSPNIGIRSYGKDWKLVAEMGAARITAMQKGGVSTCPKHFPGKGHAPVDAHLGLPIIQSTWEEMEAVHLKPFLKALEVGVDSVMTSHPYYPNLDPEPNMIATFSRKIVHERLRKNYGYKGVIFSDDLEMGAIKAVSPIDQAGIRATQAGHDILLVCHDMNLQKQVYQALFGAYKSKTLPLRELEESYERIEELINKRKKRFEGGAPKAERQGIALADKICDEAVTFFRNPVKRSVKEWKRRKLLVVFPQFSSLAQKIMIEKRVCDEKKYVLSHFKKLGLKPEVKVVGIEPTSEEIMEIQSRVGDFDTTLLFCFDAHLYPSNKQLLDGVQVRSREAIVALLRDSYDESLVHKNASCLTCFGWRACQMDSIFKKLFSR